MPLPELELVPILVVSLLELELLPCPELKVALLREIEDMLLPEFNALPFPEVEVASVPDLEPLLFLELEAIPLPLPLSAGSLPGFEARPVPLPLPRFLCLFL